VDTQSDPTAALILVRKTKGVEQVIVQRTAKHGIMDAETDEFGYVYAPFLPTVIKRYPGNLLLRTRRHGADCSGHKCQAHPSPYDGADIVLPTIMPGVR